MYHKLARGHASAYLNALTDHSEIDRWFEGARCKKALRSFEESAFSKKPGRTVKRIAPFLRPAFTRPAVGLWMKEFKLVMAEAVTVAQEARIFDLAGADAPLYQERSVFLSNLFMSHDPDECSARIMTLANISHHALKRLLERELATPDTIGREVRHILSLTRNMAMTFDRTSLDPGETYAFLAPYKGGALPIVTMEVKATDHDKDVRQPIMAVRTFLDADMLGREDHERMGGFEAAMEAITADEPHKQMSRWMEVNARPWTLRAAAAAEAERQTETRRKIETESPA